MPQAVDAVSGNLAFLDEIGMHGATERCSLCNGVTWNLGWRGRQHRRILMSVCAATAAAHFPGRLTGKRVFGPFYVAETYSLPVQTGPGSPGAFSFVASF